TTSQRMSGTLDVTTAVLFLLVVFPGLVSTTIYRLIMPARVLDWGNALLQGLFYSTVNFVLGLPFLFWLVFGYDPLAHPIRYSLAAILLLFVTPVAWPIALVAIFKSRRVARRIQIPYPTAWDAFFDQREPAFVLVHLNNGKLLGGYWGGNSYAGSFPNDGDIYLEAVYAVDASGRFGDPIPNTLGVLLRKDQYSYIELFSVPRLEATRDGQEQSEQKRQV
ncbi:MAG: DUF6338 family protein, partial [Gemmatimonadaceae bacterium]